MSISTDQRDYDEARSAQSFFRNAIEHCMNGKTTELGKLIDDYLYKNPRVTTQDLLLNFQSEGKTLIHIAASSGRPDVLDYVLSKAATASDLVNLADEKGFTPLINATISESDAMIATLIKLGANVNASNKDGATAAHYAAADCSVSRLTLLVDAGANLSYTSQSGTPLHWAAGKGCSSAIKYLVGKGCDVNSVSGSGLPAVIMAAVSACDEGVKCLVEAGADTGTIVTGNVTLLHICAEHGLRDSVTALLKTESGKKCCQVETNEGNTPIYLAAMTGHRDIVELLHADSFPGSSDAAIATVPDVDSIMIEGARRMKLWEEKAKAEEEAKKEAEAKKHAPSMATTTVSAEMIAPAASPAAAAEAEEHKEKGNEAYKKKDYTTAIEEYSAAIRLQGDNAALWSNRSACYLSMGDSQRALFDAEVCRRLRPDWPKGCFRLASARLALGLFEDAAVAAFEGCKLDESNKDLKELMQKAVQLGREDHQKKLASQTKK